MKNTEIVQLLSDASVQQSGAKSYENRCVLDNDFDTLAESIVKLFSIPDVVGQSEQVKCSICGREHKKFISDVEGNKICKECSF